MGKYDLELDLQTARRDKTALARTKPQEITVDRWLRGWWTQFPDRRSEKTIAHNQYQLVPFREKHGKRKMCEITPLEAQAWTLDNPSQIKFLKRAWRKATLMGIAPMNVWNVVEFPERTKPRRRPPTDDELAVILANCRERGGWFAGTLYPMLQFAAYTGARPGGLASLKAEQVDLDANRAILHEKGSKTRSVVLCGPARDAARVAMQEWRTRNRFVIKHRGLLWLDENYKPILPETISRAFQEVRGDFPFSPHTLRHYAATWLMAQGADPMDVATQLGHTDSENRPYLRYLEKVYNHPDPEDALKRIEGIVR